MHPVNESGTREKVTFAPGEIFDLLLHPVDEKVVILLGNFVVYNGIRCPPEAQTKRFRVDDEPGLLHKELSAPVDWSRPAGLRCIFLVGCGASGALQAPGSAENRQWPPAGPPEGRRRHHA